MKRDVRINRNVVELDIVKEPLLFPVKRNGQPIIHLARLIKEFFGLQKGFGYHDKPC